MQNPALRRGSAVFRDWTSAGALAALAGILRLLAGLLAAALLAGLLLTAALLLLVGLVLPTLLLVLAIWTLTRVLRILVHGHSPCCPAPNRQKRPVKAINARKPEMFLSICLQSRRQRCAGRKVAD
jgi:hypothetical protein